MEPQESKSPVGQTAPKKKKTKKTGETSAKPEEPIAAAQDETNPFPSPKDLAALEELGRAPEKKAEIVYSTDKPLSARDRELKKLNR